MAIQDWAPQLKSVLEGITGIEQVHNYDEIPATLAVFPCALILPQRGSQVYGAGGPNVALHQVQVTIYVSGQIVPEGYAVAIPLIESVRDAIAAHVTLNSSVNYCLPPDPPQIFYEGPGAIAFNYGDKTHLGVIFHLVVKETETVTVTA